MSSNECQELKNIKYQTMLLSGNKKDIKSNSSNNIMNMEDFLENKCLTPKNESWSKLDKTTKINCLNEYANHLNNEQNMSEIELVALKKYLSQLLDKKKLQRIKDVIYESEKGAIKDIPNLHYNKASKKYILKKDQKKVSTLKSLGTKSKKKDRTEKNHEKPKTSKNKPDKIKKLDKKKKVKKEEKVEKDE